MPPITNAPLVGRFNRKRSEQWAYVFVICLALFASLAWREAEVHEIVIGMIACGVVLAFVHIGQRQIQNAPGPHLIIDGTGVVLPEYFVHRVPWEAIASIRVVRRHERADMLVLDEPFTGMNPEETRQMMDLMFKVRDRGVTILLVEHDMQAIMGLCDRITVMNFGQLLVEGAPKDIRNDPKVIEAYLGGARHVA